MELGKPEKKKKKEKDKKANMKGGLGWIRHELTRLVMGSIFPV